MKPRSIPPPMRPVHSAAKKSSVVPENDYDSLLAENMKLSERLKELTDKIETSQKYDESIGVVFDERLKTISEKIQSNTVLENKLDYIIQNHFDEKHFDDKLEKMSSDIRAVLQSKQKTYEEQYTLLQKRYTDLKQKQEEQFFKFTHIISNYQMLIFKIMSTQTSSIPQDEVQKMNELMSAITQPKVQTSAFSYTPHAAVHTPHPQATGSVPPVRKHHSSIGFRLNIPSRTNEEEVLSETDYN